MVEKIKDRNKYRQGATKKPQLLVDLIWLEPINLDFRDDNLTFLWIRIFQKEKQTKFRFLKNYLH